jgi:hypothetical protein
MQVSMFLIAWASLVAGEMVVVSLRALGPWVVLLLEPGREALLRVVGEESMRL